MGGKLINFTIAQKPRTAGTDSKIVKQTCKMFEELSKKLPLLKDKYIGYLPYWHRIEVPAATILIREGEIAKKIFLIEKGCIRTWINSNGRDITFQFFFENEAVSASESFRKNIPSFFTLETIEPSVLYWIHKKDWELVMNDISQVPGMRNKGTDVILTGSISI